MAEMVEAALLAVALARRIDEGQVARASRRRRVVLLAGQKTLFERDRDLFGEADADEAAGRDRVAVADQLHRLFGGDDLAFLDRFQKRQSGMYRHDVLPSFSAL